MSSIHIQGMRFRAYHGCIAEEALSGTDFEVSVLAQMPMIKAATTDSLHDALDYCAVYEIVKEEINIPSKLIEHVAGRIYNRMKQFDYITECHVQVSKLNPPVNGYITQSTVVYNGE
jgi:7,8-dihydroneopterin aldolase/epimerase/oxygenase